MSPVREDRPSDPADNPRLAICRTFALRYPDSAMRQGGQGLRLRDWESRLPACFSSLERRLAFLEAMEALERDGILTLHWARRRIGDDLVSAELADAAALYRELGRLTPEEEAGRLAACAEALVAGARTRGDTVAADILARMAILPDIEPAGLEDAARFLATAPAIRNTLPIRALSVRLFRDSKRLEAILPHIESAVGGSADLELPERSFPEVNVAGSVLLRFRDGSSWNVGGRILNIALETVLDIEAIVPVACCMDDAESGTGSRPGRAVTVENKETFYGFARTLHSRERGMAAIALSGGFDLDLVVLTGGRPNRAVAALLSLLASCGWNVRHAGDLDPDGIAILGDVHALCGALPLAMDSPTFALYADCARPLSDSILARLRLLDARTLALPGIASLADSIREAESGVEQEVIDYWGFELIRGW